MAQKQAGTWQQYAVQATDTMHRLDTLSGGYSEAYRDRTVARAQVLATLALAAATAGASEESE